MLERHRQRGQRLRLPGRGTDGPVSPHGRHPLSGGRRRSAGRDRRSLRRAAQGRAEPHRYRPSPGKGSASRHQGHPPEVRGMEAGAGALHWSGAANQGKERGAQTISLPRKRHCQYTM